MPDLPCTMHENLLGEIKEAKVNEGPHPTSLRSATFPIGEGKAVERLRSKPAFPSGEGARRADEVPDAADTPSGCCGSQPTAFHQPASPTGRGC